MSSNPSVKRVLERLLQIAKDVEQALKDLRLTPVKIARALTPDSIVDHGHVFLHESGNHTDKLQCTLCQLV
jgi:hypothetical protein